MLVSEIIGITFIMGMNILGFSKNDTFQQKKDFKLQ